MPSVLASAAALDLPWPFLGAQGLVAGGVMVLLWGLHLGLRNAALVDVGWAGLLGAVGVWDAIAGGGTVGRRVALGVLVGLWSLRLTLHLVRERVLEGEEEGRYRRLRALWGRRANLLFLPFFLGQAALVLVLSVPFLLAASSDAPFPGVLDLLAVLVFAVSIAGEAIADRQLARFRARPESRGRTCREGLWGWSRHPNYFFEWLVWIAYALLAVTAPAGWLAFLAPLLILLFVTKVTGIPPTEAQALRSRGDDYRRYQAEVSAFVPWPPRREETPR